MAVELAPLFRSSDYASLPLLYVSVDCHPVDLKHFQINLHVRA
jgi:hypothetical protein